MQHQAILTRPLDPAPARPKVYTLRERADDVLVALAILGLVATVADGEADPREIDQFSREFRNQFALSKQSALKLIGIALRRIRTTDPERLIPMACDTLNEHLTTDQRLRVFDGLVEVLIADGRVHEGEECFLDYVASRLCLVAALEKRFTSDKLADLDPYRDPDPMV